MVLTTSETTPKAGRRCSEPGCETILSRYNRAEKCFAHDRPGPTWTGLRGTWDRTQERTSGEDISEVEIPKVQVAPRKRRTRKRTRRRTQSRATTELLVEVPEGRPLYCPACDRKCRSWQSLTAHAASAHQARIVVEERSA